MKILISGKNGLVATALAKEKSYNHTFIFVGRAEADLTKEKEVDKLFAIIEPDWVIHCAANVGGIGGNEKHHADYFYENILMNSYVIHFAQKYNVKKLLAFSSVCVFPDNLPLLQEDLMHKGEPFIGNFAYAYAKRMIDVQIRAYKNQHDTKNFCSIIPTNIFGEEDFYNLESGHVIPALIHKLYIAKRDKQPFNVWGNGQSKRELIYSRDLAKIILKIIELPNLPERIIVSNSQQVTIKELVERLCKVADFQGEVLWQLDKPNGQVARPTDLSLLISLLGDFEYTDLDIALRRAYDWFANNYAQARI